MKKGFKEKESSMPTKHHLQAKIASLISALQQDLITRKQRSEQNT